MLHIENFAIFLFGIEIILFLILTCPLPKGWKSKILNFVLKSEITQKIIYASIGFLLILAYLFFSSLSEA